MVAFKFLSKDNSLKFKQARQYFTDKNNLKKFFVLGFILVLLLIVFIASSLAALTPVRSIVIRSQNTSYENKKQGSWEVKETINWVSGGKAELVFDINSIVKSSYDATDILLVLDTSSTMNEGEYLVDDIYKSRLDIVKDTTKDLVDTLLNDSKNRFGLITFDTDSTIINDFTNDKEALINSIDSLVAEGQTNYYQALVKVDEVLKNYQASSNTRTVVLFLTDGYPVTDTPNEVGQYKYLKDQYPNVLINAVQYEMGDRITQEVKNISDNQFSTGVDNLYDVLFDASIDPMRYQKFLVEALLANNYFTVDTKSITKTIGNVNVVDDNGSQKIVIDLSNDVLRAGKTEQVVVGLKLKDELLNKGGIYPILTNTHITSKIDLLEEDILETKTPIIDDSFKVIYDSNIPAGCSMSGTIPATSNHSVFTTVTISDQKLKCDNYQFKGWKVTPYTTKDKDGNDIKKDVEKINDDNFKMPEADVTIKAEWSKLSLNKSMDGTIFEVATLYTIMRDSSVPDNIQSEFVSSPTGIKFDNNSSDTNGKGVYEFTSSDKYDGEKVYYYRGDVDNNNVLFGNFCWKAVRTTETGGVKLIYNGLPNATGECLAEGEATTIGKGSSGNSSNFPAYVGYMYGEKFEARYKDLYWYSLEGKSVSYKSGMSETMYYYSDTVTWDGTNYTLVDPGEPKLWSSNYSTLKGKYTCLSGETVCGEVKYITSGSTTQVRTVTLSGGETKESIEEKFRQVKWVWGNDVEYNNGVYTLVDTFASSPIDWGKDRSTIGKKYHYTCFTTGDVCEEIYYIVRSDINDSIYFLTLNNVDNIKDAKEKMFTNFNDSKMKEFIESWYENNMTEYTKYLEDTEWCNDRSISRGLLKDENSSGSSSYFGKFNREINPSLTCERSADRLTTKNGLRFPTALLTADEARLAGYDNVNKKFYLYNGNKWWTLSPCVFSNWASIYFVDSYIESDIYVDGFVRPSVSLKKGLKVIDGDGTAINPYQIEKLEDVISAVKVDPTEYVKPSVSKAKEGETVKLITLIPNEMNQPDERYKILSFKLNGQLINGDSFVMPNTEANITDVRMEFTGSYIIESNHNPYHSSNTIQWSEIIPKAKSLTVVLDYQTQSTTYDYIYLYDKDGNIVNNKKYGGSTRKTETITVPGDIVTIKFTTNGSLNNYYGFKATVTANY